MTIDRLAFAPTRIYFLERNTQPEAFETIPMASWWALSTLTTVGYGDVVSVTPFGKALVGVVMLLGVGMFAPPVAIIVTRFSQDSMRHQFVATRSVVALVPVFDGKSRLEIAGIIKLLETKSFDPGVPIERAGDAGDGMYIVASGQAQLAPGGRRTLTLGEGDPFGEMVLLDQRHQEHDVIATIHCRVYVLDSRTLRQLSRRYSDLRQRLRLAATSRNNEHETTV